VLIWLASIKEYFTLHYVCALSRRYSKQPSIHFWAILRCKNSQSTDLNVHPTIWKDGFESVRLSLHHIYIPDVGIMVRLCVTTPKHYGWEANRRFHYCNSSIVYKTRQESCVQLINSVIRIPQFVNFKDFENEWRQVCT